MGREAIPLQEPLWDYNSPEGEACRDRMIRYLLAERPMWREEMDGYNLTTVTHFILTGLSDLPKVRYPLFVVFAVIYQVTMVGNGTILLAIGTEKKLHTPMYYFLANLSLLDIFCPSATVPKMLDNLLTGNHSISFLGCASQLYFLVALAGTEVFLLAVMAYDRYVAICFPLRYTLIMTKARCAQLAAGTWAAGFLNSLLHTVSTFHLSFCKSNRVNQYYCDIPPVVALSCSSTYLAEVLVFVVGGVSGIGAFLTTFISYIYIISTILKIQETPCREEMDGYNLTPMTHFILMGFSDLPKVHYPLFVVFAVTYQVTLVGNGAILLVIGTEKKLCTPMYYFLANLSLLDIFCPSATVPKMLDNLLTGNHSISFLGCALQLYFLVAQAGTEVFLLTVMAYDPYMAICFPLRQPLIMTKACCAQLIGGTWASGFLNSLLHTVSTFRLSLCKSSRVNQYYCDVPPVVALSCSSTYMEEMFILVVAEINYKLQKPNRKVYSRNLNLDIKRMKTKWVIRNSSGMRKLPFTQEFSKRPTDKAGTIIGFDLVWQAKNGKALEKIAYGMFGFFSHMGCSPTSMEEGINC
ncbi:Olfactory Receptor 5V1 [Manis pentadactyla]|nr:Olfactory Receptor 5V1 [Manis pentadactyla]